MHIGLLVSANKLKLRGGRGKLPQNKVSVGDKSNTKYDDGHKHQALLQQVLGGSSGVQAHPIFQPVLIRSDRDVGSASILSAMLANLERFGASTQWPAVSDRQRATLIAQRDLRCKF